MNYIKHLNEIFLIFDNDPRIGVYHISLYMALFRQWNRLEFKNPIQINRELMMEKAKIKSPKTYAKTMEELSKWGYLNYKKSTSRIFGSKIDLFPTSVLNEQVVPPYKNLINNKHIYKGKKYESFSENQIFNFSEDETSSSISPTNLEHVKIYFNEKRASEIEAEKFFNYYEARGWLNNSQNPITNWKAAARNWILNIAKYNPTQKKQKHPKKQSNKTDSSNIQTSSHHQLNQNKRYDTPL